jgi:hypothetical protein
MHPGQYVQLDPSSAWIPTPSAHDFKRSANSNKRFAGQIFSGEDLSAVLGMALGGVAVNNIAHDQMDEIAQDVKDARENFNSLMQNKPQAAAAYTQLFTKPMSGMDHIIVGGILDGSIPPPKDMNNIGADSKEGEDAILLALNIRANDPELGSYLGHLSRISTSITAKSQKARYDKQDVERAIESGAGESPIPAAAGMMLGGTAGYLAHNHLAKR